MNLSIQDERKLMLVRRLLSDICILYQNSYIARMLRMQFLPPIHPLG